MAKNTISLEHTSAGIPVITETIPGAINSGYMIAVNTGSRDETSDIFGLSHLLEHVVFRATKSRTSFQMSKEIEGAGGEMNAFTAKEMTAFYAVTIKDTAKVAQDIVADIVTNPLIADNDTEMEKKIVLQEISMVENQPTSYIHDLFDEAIWKGHELAQSEAGTREIVKSLKNTDLRKYYEEKYKVPNFKVFACGAVDPADTVEWAEKNLDALGGDKATKRTKPQVTGASYTYHKRKEEHCYVGMGFRTFEPTNKDLPALRLLSAILGAGSSSRLFQSVREEKALVYSVYNSVSQFTDASTFATFMSSTEENVLESIETTAKTYRLLKENGLTENELQRSKNLLKGAFARQMESTSDRLYSMARNTMLIGTPKSIEERLEAFDAVTEEDVMRVAQKVLDPKGLNIVMFGNEVKSMKDFDVAQLDF